MQKSKHLRNYYKAGSRKELVKFADLFERSVFEVYRKTIDTAVEELYTYIINVLENQTYNWKPLNETYKKRKEKLGLSGKILIATGDYLEAIHYTITETTAMVGVPDALHKPSGLKYNVLARIHEFGSKKMNVPSRQLWRPALSWWIRQWNAKHKRQFIVNSKKDLLQKMQHTNLAGNGVKRSNDSTIS